jgi:hypothetical protein
MITTTVFVEIGIGVDGEALVSVLQAIVSMIINVETNMPFCQFDL